MRWSMLIGLLMFTAATLLALSWWQSANLRVRQQALQLRINALRAAQDEASSSEMDVRSRGEQLQDMQRELEAVRARSR